MWYFVDDWYVEWDDFWYVGVGVVESSGCVWCVWGGGWCVGCWCGGDLG